EGHIELFQETAGKTQKRGSMACPSFYYRQNNIPKTHNFSFKLSHEVHSKFAATWSLGNYVLDVRNLNILVHPMTIPLGSLGCHLWDAAVIVRTSGTMVRTSRRDDFDNKTKSWPPVSG